MATVMAEERRTPDVTRDGGGFRIGLTYLPDFWPPEERRDAAVTVHTGDGKVLLDTVMCSADEAPDVFNHTVFHSKRYAEALA